MSRDRELRVLGIIGHNYLRETGFIRMRENVRIAYFGPPDSALHRIADYSCPLACLDVTEDDLLEAVSNAKDRGIELDGFISLRDPNVPAAIGVARRMWPRRTSSVGSIKRVSSKLRFRQWLNHNPRLTEDVVVRVPYAAIPRDETERRFCDKLSLILRNGPVIIKPECGSCSYDITRLETVKDIPSAWRQFKLASSYRSGGFLAEQEIVGDEYAVETVIDQQIRHIGITGYIAPGSGVFYEVGHFAPDRLSSTIRMRIQRLTETVHNALPIRYLITHMEIKIREDGMPVIIELNPRLAGDLTQELHRLTTGIDYYKIAAHLATSPEPIPASYFSGKGGYRCALIRFSPPTSGRIRQVENPAKFFRSRDDRFGFCHPCGSVLAGGATNDDRGSYILLAGGNYSELNRRSMEALEKCLAVDRAPFITSPL